MRILKVMKSHTIFSSQLESWLKSKSPNTIDNLESVFGNRSFSIVFLLLMALPALPIPTGGITHVLLAVCMLLALEQICGLRRIWLPKFIRKRPLPGFFIKKLLPTLMRTIRKVEKFSKPRGTMLLQTRVFNSFAGFIILIAALSAFFAPPFSGLDTFPAFGAVVVSIGILVSDILFVIIGSLIVLAGIVLQVTVGTALFTAIKKYIVHGNTTTRLIAAGLLLLLVIVLVVRHRKK